MKIVVPMNLVPDLVEELTIDDNGTTLDMTWLRLTINEFDDHAIEQAILLKEINDSQVVVLAPEVEGVDDILFTATAKGADQVIKLIGDFEAGVNSHALARAFSDVIKDLQPDIVLTGVQAHNDQDGSVGTLLAEYLGMPYIGYVSGVNLQNGKAITKKEYPGGLIGEMEVALPAVLGIQAAEQPPRYVAISKVRQAMKTSSLEEREVAELNQSGGPKIDRMFQPEAGERATMIEGDEDTIAAKLIVIFEELGIL